MYKRQVYDREKSQAMKETLGVSEKLVIGHVGRFFPQKNHRFLIEIFKEIHDRNADAVLLLVGGGELDDSLKNEIKQKVEDLGLTDCVQFLGVREDVNELMQAFDLFLLPSLFEGLPVTMVEAQASGLPCVISVSYTHLDVYKRQNMVCIMPPMKVVTSVGTILRWKL